MDKLMRTVSHLIDFLLSWLILYSVLGYLNSVNLEDESINYCIAILFDFTHGVSVQAINLIESLI